MDDSIRLACDGLAKEMTQHIDDGEARKLAIWLAGICKRSAGVSTLEAQSNLYLLIDLSTFFQYYHAEKFEACMEIIKKLKCLPLDPDEVQAFVSTFYMVSDQMRLVLPDLCMAVMKLILEEVTRRSEASDDLRLRAKAIILYVGMIPYRFPSQISSQILQLENYFD
ncbi:unnamed protein product [Gongylonema pulchrum]|uniref:Nuclear pore protein n=1 Tax=Gongylonema pulchrum TaxID=637853 RepID=A0A3P6P3D7_9BILA|nr:unnamed protein product [Gongylonema pulchrum]